MLDALAERERLPFVRRADGLAVLHCAGEQAWAIDVESESAQRRAELAQADGLDRVLVAPSSPIGLEALTRDDAQTLIDAHMAGVETLGSPFIPWGPMALDHPDPDDVDALLARGCFGITLPAGALAGPDALAEIEPVLVRAETLGAMVFVHPGPARGSSLSQPLWWAGLTDYVSQMQAAWLTFATLGRRRHPTLRILFAILAGGAPLHAERLAARGGPPVELRDPLTFYETSSYGPAAIEALAHQVGPDQLVYGSDRPVIDPPWTDWDGALQANAARLIEATATQTRVAA